MPPANGVAFSLLKAKLIAMSRVRDQWEIELGGRPQWPSGKPSKQQNTAIAGRRHYESVFQTPQVGRIAGDQGDNRTANDRHANHAGTFCRPLPEAFVDEREK